MNIGITKRIKLFIFGRRYYNTNLLPFMALKRYGFERYYSLSQIRQSSKALGYENYYEEDWAVSLIGNPSEMVSFEKYELNRKKFGLLNGGAFEVLKVFLKIEKVPTDPFGRDQAAENAGGMD